MINDKLIDTFLKNAGKTDLIRGIKQVFNYLENDYRYEELVNNIINIIGGDTLTTIDDIDLELIKANIDKLLYKAEEIDKDSIEISNISNIDKTVKITYKRNDNDYQTCNTIDYIDYLKKVKEN